MDQNPLEQQKNKIDIVKKEAEKNFGKFFDEKESFGSKIDSFVLQLESLERDGLVFNKEEIIKDLRESVEIQNKDEFVAYLSKILNPIIMLRFTRPKAFGKVERESIMNDHDTLNLSKFLYISKKELDNETDKIFFHLASALDFITKEQIEDFKQDIQKGLDELADVIEPYPNIKEIWASSWIIAKPRGKKRIEDLGFTYAGMVPEEENDTSFFDEQGRKKPFAKAFMKREDFLARYGNKQ
jgi:hypothetical protein